MAIAITFTPSSMTQAQYDQVIKRLHEGGNHTPTGRLFHVCSGNGSNLTVLDIWESESSFQEFGRVLMPLLAEAGINMGQPAIQPVHNTIWG